jgi:tetratricopeptide (TPR) repeat protein
MSLTAMEYHPSPLQHSQQQQQQQQHSSAMFSDHYLQAPGTRTGGGGSQSYVGDEEEYEDDVDNMNMNMSNNNNNNNNMPNEADLVLLCLDHLRDLRRAYSADPSLLREQEGLQADYLTMACWALNRAFCPEQLPNLAGSSDDDHAGPDSGGNDCWSLSSDPKNAKSKTYFSSSNHSRTRTPCFPSLPEMERELLYMENNPTNDSNNNNNDHNHHHYNTNSSKNTNRGGGDQKKDPDYEDDYSPSSSPDNSDNNAHEQQQQQNQQQQPQNQYYNCCYEYNDNHVSNAHRFYSLDGLASGGGPLSAANSTGGGGGAGSLTLGEIVAAGLVGLGARTRWQAEQEMLHTPLFEQFVAAVQAKGFFYVSAESNANNTPDSHHDHEQAAQALYEERFRKVVSKFRVKLAHKAMTAAAAVAAAAATSSSSSSAISPSQQQQQHHMDDMMMQGDEMAGGGNGHDGADWMALRAAEQQRKRREHRLAGHNNYSKATPGTPLDEIEHHHLQAGRHDRYNNHSSSSSNYPLHANVANAASDVVKRTAFAQRLFADVSDQRSVVTSASAQAAAAASQTMQGAGENPADLQEAERLKMNGNSFMKQKEYEKAADCYTAALKLSPAGPQAHVYFSNRAAALVSLRKFSKAILDSERSLSLKPDYGKAHARLGLAHFLLGNYRQAIQAYTLALKYEPDNKSSQSYMEKATKRLAETRQSSASPVSSNNNNLSAVEGVTGRPPKKSGGHDHISRSNSNTAAPARDDNSHSHHSSSSSHGGSASGGGHCRSSSNASHSTLLRDEKEAEKCKTKGNALMANREYTKALEQYNQAIRLSPTGPQSHVYYSNRAAALCYLECYKEAEEDSIQSLSFDPTYGKAHARLGLSRFFLQKYEGAVEAYSDALKYDPDNSASRSYLAKAKAKLDEAAFAARISNATNNVSVSPPESTARRLMTDESVRIMTLRAMQDPSSARDLLHDPEMIRLSKKAMVAMRKS